MAGFLSLVRTHIIFTVIYFFQEEGIISTHRSLGSCSKRGRYSKEEELSAIDYANTHERDTKKALRHLQTSSSVASNSRAPLLSLLTNQGRTFHLPHVLLPREFRAKHLSGNTQVVVGKHSGLVSKELGRGAYGVVVLMDVEDKDQSDTIAVKAQSPTDCLAWEYEVLRRLEDRVASKQSGEYSFPRALSFISLADGGILSMTAGSKSGLNLVDLSNAYRIKLGEPVPELVTFHYTSRMLRHLEILHWHGKILVCSKKTFFLVLIIILLLTHSHYMTLQHCDVKPDNFVLSTLECQDNDCRDIEHSDIMLVDFGRAVDLTQFSKEYDDVRKAMLRGNACREDMRCVAMRNGKPWSFDADTYGILCSVHVLLFGTHIDIRKGKNSRWHVDNAFKRYWQKDLWGDIFDTLLNLDEESGAVLGSRARSLRALREKIDAYLKTEKEHLRYVLSRQVNLLPASREKL